MIYLDNAATTQISESVLNAMMPYLEEEYGNPGALYSHGVNAKKAVDKAREQVASFMNCRPDQIVFTSSGSEGNNMIIKGTLMKRVKDGFSRNETLVSSIEHESVLNACRDATDVFKGSSYRLILPNNMGFIEPETIRNNLTKYTHLVSVMYVNNETGASNDIRYIADICHGNGTKFHTDCTQAAGFYSLDMQYLCCDYATVSAHKLHGPKGVGAVYIKDASTIVPLISGSFSQEHGLRGGTENVAGIVGFGQACADAAWLYDECTERQKYVADLKTRFLSVLKNKVEECTHKNRFENIVTVNGLVINGRILNLTIKGIDAQTLVLSMSADDVCISAGSACCAHDILPSHVLVSMGLSEEDAASSVRISFSETNTFEDVENAAVIMAKNIIKLYPKRN